MNRKSSKSSGKARSEGKQKSTQKAVKSRRAVTAKSTKGSAKAAANLAPSFRSHRRVTVYRATPAAAMGMHAQSKMTHAGSTAHFDVSYMTTLRQKGAALAQAILQNCERDYSTLQQIFGGLTPQRMPFVVQITSGATGASHSSCMGTDIAVGGKSGSAVDFIRSLLVAEADEVFMASFGHGWDCGASNGEGLSRVLANDIYQGVEPAGFISSNSWLNSAREDFVNNTLPDDTDYPSIGCSVLFLNWLRFQLNYSWANIVAAGAGTLAGTYKNLTGKSTAWNDFNAVIDAHFPAGHQSKLKTDNPFPL
jgi:hypothetical protein